MTTVPKSRASFLQLSPFVVFVAIFLVSTLVKGWAISPVFACLVAVIYALLCTFRVPLPFNERVALFVQGASNTTVLAMVYIFVFSSVFTHALKLVGGIDAAVNLGLYLLPSSLLLPGFFAVVSAFATVIGSSMGTIAAFLPVGIGFASSLGISPALMAGTVVSGAMLGDNLSLISDTTIAATQTTGSRMKDKFDANVKLVIPAFLATCLVLWYMNHSLVNAVAATPIAISMGDVVRVIPYGMIFALALLGLDVIAVLVIGILFTIAIGVYYGAFSFVHGTQLVVIGFSADADIHMTMLLSLFVAGLAYIVEFNGGLSYLLERWSTRIRSARAAEASIAALIFLVNAAVAINTIAILVVGPVAKKIADSFGISGKRTACLLDIFACICQGMLPYAPQLLLASSLAGVSSVAIMPYLYYQGFILLVTIGSIWWTRSRAH